MVQYKKGRDFAEVTDNDLMVKDFDVLLKWNVFVLFLRMLPQGI